MSAEDHQHAQWLASLASGHFVQQAMGSQDSSQSDNPLFTEDDGTAGEGDMSVQPVVRLDHEPSVPLGTTVTPLNFTLRKAKRKQEREEPTRHEEYKLFPPKDRGAKVQDMRRPVRPIDRQKMRPWLKNLLDTGDVHGLNWLQREEGIFHISWRHASRLGWNLETDGDVFERWARHTGIYKDGDEPEPKRWKANFRCALHSLPDVKELTSPTDRKGRNASRTYRFLRPFEVQPPVKRKQRYNIPVPYPTYENPASEDSRGSQQGESDERNTDDEFAAAPVEQQQTTRAFPHCDHDYAIKTEEEQQMTSAVLAKHNSGYVLIKSKDAYEFEFRLTAPASDSDSAPTLAKKPAPTPRSSSPQKKGKETKKKASPAKKGKGKASPKGKQAKKKKGSEKEASPASKVSLKALLSGRKGAAAKKGKGAGKASPAAAKKTKEGKKAAGSTKSKSKKEAADSSSGPGTPTQSQGLQALLEAASQIDKMDALTSAPNTTPTHTQTSSPAKATRRAVAAAAAATSVSAVLSRPVASATVQSTAATATVTSFPASVATMAPVIFTQSMLGGSVPAGATVLAPLPAGTQIPVAVLQKLLGLSNLLPGTVTVASGTSIPVQVVPASSVSAPAKPVTQQLKVVTTQSGRTIRRRSAEVPTGRPNLFTTVVTTAPATAVATPVSVPKTAAVVSTPVSAIPLLMAQPEAGTSMLKHLLRLTGPAITPNPSPSGSTPSNLIPAAPKLFSPLVSATATKTASEPSSASPEPVSAEFKTLVKTEHLEQRAPQGEGEYVLGTSQISFHETMPRSSFPYIRVSKVFVKEEDGEVTEASTGGADKVIGEEAFIQSSDTAPESAESAAVELAVESPVKMDQSPSFISGQSAVTVQQLAGPVVSDPTPHLTLHLPQSSGSMQVQSAPNQTVTMTLPQMTMTFPQVSLTPGTSSGTVTQSLDLMQILSMLSSSGQLQGNVGGHVIIKTEPSMQSDTSVMCSAYSIPTTHSMHNIASANTIKVSTSAQEQADHSVVVMAEDHEMGEEDMPSSSAEENITDVLMQAAEQAEVQAASGNSVEMIHNQFIINEADISSLAAEQHGADNFVVDNML